MAGVWLQTIGFTTTLLHVATQRYFRQLEGRREGGLPETLSLCLIGQKGITEPPVPAEESGVTPGSQ